MGQGNRTQRPYDSTQLGQGNQTQRPYMGKDHIWDSTQWDKETGPKDHRIQHSWDRETRPKDHIWAKTIYGIQHSGTRKPDPKTIGFNTVGTGKPDPKTIYGQRPYMGFNTVGHPKTIGFNTVGTGRPDPKTIFGHPYMGFNTWDRDSTHRETRPKDPKDLRIQHSWDRETRPKDHIWAKTIFWQRPYMGFNTKPDPKTIGFNTVGTGKPDPKTIYGIQHSGTGKLDPKTIGFNTVGTGRPDPKTIFGQRPYMGFNTVGQGNQTQRP